MTTVAHAACVERPLKLLLAITRQTERDKVFTEADASHREELTKS